MKLHCSHCDKDVKTTISFEKRDKLKQRVNAGEWTAFCPHCGNTFDVTMPTGRIVVCFADDEKRPESFKDMFDGQNIMHYHAFDTVEAFIAWWIPQTLDWEGMWYYVLDSGTQICSGAVDPYDLHIWCEHFGFDVIRNAVEACRTKGIDCSQIDGI